MTDPGWAATVGPDTDGLPERCVIIVDESLPPGLAANAAGVLATTIGATPARLRRDASATPEEPPPRPQPAGSVYTAPSYASSTGRP